MDEDVQKALKQILMMCKVPGQAKDACWDRKWPAAVRRVNHCRRRRRQHTLPQDKPGQNRRWLEKKNKNSSPFLTLTTLARQRKTFFFFSVHNKKPPGLFLLRCAPAEVRAWVGAAVNSIRFMIQRLYVFSVSWLSTFSSRHLNYYTSTPSDACPRRPNVTSFSNRTSTKKNAWYGLYCYFPMSTKKNS